MYLLLYYLLDGEYLIDHQYLILLNFTIGYHLFVNFLCILPLKCIINQIEYVARTCFYRIMEWYASFVCVLCVSDVNRHTL